MTNSVEKRKLTAILSADIQGYRTLMGNNLPHRWRPGNRPDLLGEAIAIVDQATNTGPAYNMINCAHPTHFTQALDVDEPWLSRIRAIRANASDKSHTELDQAEARDAGDPLDLADRIARLLTRLPHLNILGGCCGTDHHHVDAICRSVTVH